MPPCRVFGVGKESICQRTHCCSRQWKHHCSGSAHIGPTCCFHSCQHTHLYSLLVSACHCQICHNDFHMITFRKCTQEWCLQWPCLFRCSEPCGPTCWLWCQWNWPEILDYQKRGDISSESVNAFCHVLNVLLSSGVPTGVWTATCGWPVASTCAPSPAMSRPPAADVTESEAKPVSLSVLVFSFSCKNRGNIKNCDSDSSSYLFSCEDVEYSSLNLALVSISHLAAMGWKLALSGSFKSLHSGLRRLASLKHSEGNTTVWSVQCLQG